MSSYSLLVRVNGAISFSDLPRRIKRLAAPFDQSNRKFMEFVDMTDSCLEEYSILELEQFLIRGKYFFSFEREMDDRLPAAGAERVMLPAREKYDFEQFVREYASLEMNGERAGVWRNPNARWSHFEVRLVSWGRDLEGYWATSDGQFTDIARIRDIEGELLVEPLATAYLDGDGWVDSGMRLAQVREKGDLSDWLVCARCRLDEEP